jgi:pyruvate kinase
MVAPVKHTDQMMNQVDELVLATGKGKIGEEVVVVAGTPPGVPGSTNTLRVHKLGSSISQ